MTKEEKKLTNISELGEFGLIKHLTENIKIKNDSTIKGIGDDSAIINNKNKQTVVSTDLLLEGIHFDLMYVPMKHLGYKSAIVNFSDIYAMNAEPKQITVSLGLSNRVTVEAVEELYKGIKLACDNYGVDLVGGDTSSSQQGIVISITAIGEAEKDEIIYRNGAKENDVIVVSGNLGAAYMGLQLLEREKKIFKSDPDIQPDLTGYDYILQRQLKPEARKDIHAVLKENKIKPTSMIDISDGLSSELLHICEQSGTGCKIFEDKLPVDKETIKMSEEMNLDPGQAVLNGGEDYELLFTVPLSDYDKISRIPEIHAIGHITNSENGKNLVAKNGTFVELKAQGWNQIK